MMCWRARLTGPFQPIVFYDTMISVPDMTTCVTQIYRRQYHLLTDTYSAPALLKTLFLLTVQNQIDCWRKGRDISKKCIQFQCHIL